MKKTQIVLCLIILFSAACVTEGQAADLEQEKKLGVSFKLLYMSRYMSKGEQSYGQQGGLFETVDVDLYGSGFGFSVTHQSATRSGYVKKSRFNYRPYYKNTAFKDTPYEMKYNLSTQYEHYYKINSDNANTTWEWKFAFSWPKLLGHGFVPKYTAYYEYPAHNNDTGRNKTGWHHSFGLDYALKIPELPTLTLSAAVDYRDGLGGPSKDHDWSHATLGIATKVKLSDNLTFSPGLYHQITMDKSIAPRKDITYAKLAMVYKF